MKIVHAKKCSGHSARPLVVAPPEMPVGEAIQLMKEAQIHHLVVLKDDACIGIVSMKDLLPEERAAEWYGGTKTPTVGEVMHVQIPVIDEQTDIKTALSYMLQKGFGALPMTKNGKVVGIVTGADVLSLLEHLENQHFSLKRIVERGEVAVTNPFVQNLLKALADAGL